MARSIGVLLFDDFEILDVYGALGLLCNPFSDRYKAVAISSSSKRSVNSSVRLPTSCDLTIDEALVADKPFDIFLIPGGLGVRPLLQDAEYLAKVKMLVEKTAAKGMILCVCTGSIMLAATGLLDGKECTTNKSVYERMTPLYPNVKWVRKARWRRDGQYITSGGITAGMDAALYLLELQHGKEEAKKAAVRAEYIWNENPDDDEFADLYVNPSLA